MVAGAEQSLLAETSNEQVTHIFHATANAGVPAALARLTAATGLVFSGAVIPVIRVQLVDAFQNAVHRGGVLISVTEDRASSFVSHVLGTTTVSTDAAGIATFSDLIIQALYPSTSNTVILFRADGLQSAADTAQAQYGPPVALKPDAPLGMVGVAGNWFSAAVRVTDAWNNGLEGVHIDLTYPAPDGSPVSLKAVTDYIGAARVSFQLTKAGTYSVTATSPTLPNQVVSFSVIATPGPANQLAIVSGDGASAPAGSTLSPLVVRVTDQYGNPVAGADVEWNVASGVAYLSAVSTTTDASGQSSVTLTLGTTPAPVRVRATLGGSTVSTVFTLTGT